MNTQQLNNLDESSSLWSLVNNKSLRPSCKKREITCFLIREDGSCKQEQVSLYIWNDPRAKERRYCLPKVLRRTLSAEAIARLEETGALHPKHHYKITFARVQYALAHHSCDLRGKDVHHINENPLDDRYQNLQALSRSEHQRLHVEELGDTGFVDYRTIADQDEPLTDEEQQLLELMKEFPHLETAMRREPSWTWQAVKSSAATEEGEASVKAPTEVAESASPAQAKQRYFGLQKTCTAMVDSVSFGQHVVLVRTGGNLLGIQSNQGFCDLSYRR
ncbi:MAG TPA: HNH endonuclease [Trichocoleus sp.]